MGGTLHNVKASSMHSHLFTMAYLIPTSVLRLQRNMTKNRFGQSVTMIDTHRINIEGFCSDRGFLFHRNGSGAWGNDRYWTYYKVENNDRTVFSIEYFPVRNYLKICHGNSCYQGTPESLEHMLELLSAMRIDIEELALDKDI